MKPFIHDDFLLQSKAAKKIYHDYAKTLPIIDYHNHLSPENIIKNVKYKNITEIWLYGDHYKWRAMRSCGVKERLITGDASDYDKFMAWAETMPKLLKNPLYHWSHLELKRYFGIDDLFNPDTAPRIWEQANEMLKSDDFSTRNLLNRMNAKVVCTTDDPIDSLDSHREFADEGENPFVMYPTFRPDKAMNIEKHDDYIQYLNKLAEVSGLKIDSYDALIEALRNRHDHFDELGCRASDHGIEQPYAADYTKEEIDDIFLRGLENEPLAESEIVKFKSAILYDLAIMDEEKGWVFQLHYGAIRNNNTRMYNELGPDAGYDSIGDFQVAKTLSAFLDRLDRNNHLPRTIIYNLNPNDNSLVDTMTGNFPGEDIPGKVQHGAAWWFHDQKEGMEEHLQNLSNMSILSQFIGMVTDSRSFLSFPRHEYYRRTLCNMLGDDVEKGIIPDDENLLKDLTEKLCYKNALNYFNYKKLPDLR